MELLQSQADQSVAQARRLHDLRAMDIATILSSLFAGAFLISRNFAALGDHESARKASLSAWLGCCRSHSFWSLLHVAPIRWFDPPRISGRAGGNCSLRCRQGSGQYDREASSIRRAVLLSLARCRHFPPTHLAHCSDPVRNVPVRLKTDARVGMNVGFQLVCWIIGTGR